MLKKQTIWLGGAYLRQCFKDFGVVEDRGGVGKRPHFPQFFQHPSLIWAFSTQWQVKTSASASKHADSNSKFKLSSPSLPRGWVGSTSPQVLSSARGTFSTPQGGHTFLRTPAAPAPETIFFGHLEVTFTAVPVPAAIYSSLLLGPNFRT